MRTLVLVRHAQAGSNAEAVVSGVAPGEGLTGDGRREAELLAAGLAGERIDLGVATELRRTQETLALALAGREVPRLVVPGLNEIRFGSFEGGPLRSYREWAWTTQPDEPCPGDGESRAAAASRIAGALVLLLAQEEETVLAVSHALPIRYVVDAAVGAVPAARIEAIAHATPYRLSREQVAAAAATLRAWVAKPRFRDARGGDPSGRYQP